MCVEGELLPGSSSCPLSTSGRLGNNSKGHPICIGSCMTGGKPCIHMEFTTLAYLSSNIDHNNLDLPTSCAARTFANITNHDVQPCVKLRRVPLSQQRQCSTTPTCSASPLVSARRVALKHSSSPLLLSQEYRLRLSGMTSAGRISLPVLCKGLHRLHAPAQPHRLLSPDQLQASQPGDLGHQSCWHPDRAVRDSRRLHIHAALSLAALALSLLNQPTRVAPFPGRIPHVVAHL